MKYRCWYLGHAWGRWEGDLQQFSNFHHDYVDHFVTRWRYCERCGKKENERYFVPGISPSNLSYSEVIRMLRELADEVIEKLENEPFEKRGWLVHHAHGARALLIRHDAASERK